MKGVDNRPTMALTPDELRKKVYRLMAEKEKLETMVSNMRNQINTLLSSKKSEKVLYIRVPKKEFEVKGTIEEITTFICDYFRVTEESLKGERRTGHLVCSRSGFVYVARSMGYTYKMIGEALNRDHATAINLQKKTVKYLNQQFVVTADHFINQFKKTDDASI